jgi:cytochrome c554/c'-like protein
MGGLARRVSYIKAFRQKFDRVPNLVVDSGFFLGDERSSHGNVRGDIAVRNEHALRAYDRFPVDVINLSSHDLTFVSAIRRSPVASEYRVLKRLVSANIFGPSPEITPPRMIIREMAVKAEDGQRPQPVKVAFIGLTEMTPSAPPGFRMADPIQAAGEVVPAASRSADFIIVLMRGAAADVLKLAREVPGIDVIIAGDGNMFTAPMQVNQTLVAFTPYETRTLGELRVYRDKEGKFSTRARYISLDGGVPDDPEALRVVTDSVSSDTEAYKANKTLLKEWLASTGGQAVRPSAIPGGAGPGYVGSLACAQCHNAQYIFWTSSDHARASNPLIQKEAEFEKGCLACHASGLDRSGILNADRLPSLQNVQCEQCHGPASEHATKPTGGYGRVGDLAASCSGCHTRQTSPGFDTVAAWQKIKH